MGTVNRSKVSRGLAIHLILVYVGAVRTCTVSVTQPSYLEVDYSYSAITINCTFHPTGCPTETPTSLWFRYGAHLSEKLCWNGCQGEGDKFTVTGSPAENQVSLTINRLTQNDSAIYICGIAFLSSTNSKAKQTGQGTTLVVRDTALLSLKLRNILILVLLLLSIYVVGVLGAFIYISISKSNNTLRTTETEEDSKKKSARRLFQDIAQELYRKRYLEARQ